MTKFSFLKMEGLGNDFVLFDASTLSDEKISCLTAEKNLIHIASRRFGIGCDQIILLTAPRAGEQAPFVRFFNQDGSEAGACGNGSRCVLRYLSQKGTTSLAFHTSEADVKGSISGDDVTIILPPPFFDAKHIPLRASLADNSAIFAEITPRLWQKAYACSVGNPHATLFFPEKKLAFTERERIGSFLEKHPDFPQKVNIGFAHLKNPSHIDLFVWERGAGATLACGTGACAAGINAIALGIGRSPVCVEMQGGKVQVAWQGGKKDSVFLTGAANSVFSGIIDIPPAEAA